LPKYYLDKESEEYKRVLERSLTADGPVVIGSDIYFRLDLPEGIEFTKINAEKAVKIVEEPYTVYNSELESLSELESMGDWSVRSEETARDLFRRYFTDGGYQIIALQCRQLACLIEVSYIDDNAANLFVDRLRQNRKDCNCIPLEDIWPIEKRAIFKIAFFHNKYTHNKTSKAAKIPGRAS
jgi:hypothetical protein